MSYRFGDLILASEFPCTQLPAVDAAPDCTFVLRRGRAWRPHWEQAWPAVGGEVALVGAREGDAYRLGVPGVAVFSIDATATRIAGAAEGDASAETIEHLLVDQVLPRLLAHRGRLVLHAGGLLTPFGAVAFIGESGMGKSTLCSALARAGHRVLGDDGLVVRPRPDGAPDVLATYPGLRLLPESLHELHGADVPTTPVASGRPKRRVAIGGGAGPAPLRAIYALAESRDVQIHHVRGVDAIMTLVTSSFHLHWNDPVRSRDHFERVAATVHEVPVRRLGYPRDFAALPRVVSAVIEDLAAAAA